MKTTKRTVELLSSTTLAIRPDNYYRHPLLYNVVQSGYVIGGLKHSVSRAGYNSYGLYGVIKGEVVLKIKNKINPTTGKKNARKNQPILAFLRFPFVSILLTLLSIILFSL